MSCKHLVNFHPVTLEFERVKDLHPSSISSLTTFALLLNLVGIIAMFSWAIATLVLFHLYATGHHCYAMWATRLALLRISSLV